MTCRWIFPCRRTPTVFYLGGFFCSYHARLIQGFRASHGRTLQGEGRDGAALQRRERSTAGGGSHPFDPPSAPLTEDELFDILERDQWDEVDVLAEGGRDMRWSGGDW